MCFPKAVVELLYLLSVHTLLIILVFALICGGVVKAGKGDGARLFVVMNDNSCASMRGEYVGITVVVGGSSTVFMVVGIRVFRLVCHRWICGVVSCVMGAVGLSYDSMCPPTLCGARLATL